MSYQRLADHPHLPRTDLNVGLESEGSFLRYRIKRLRTILRFARDPRTIAGLKEVIADSESRLALLEYPPQQPAQ
jgi:hypothetical protein